MNLEPAQWNAVCITGSARQLDGKSDRDWGEFNTCSKGTLNLSINLSNSSKWLTLFCKLTAKRSEILKEKSCLCPSHCPSCPNSLKTNSLPISKRRDV